MKLAFIKDIKKSGKPCKPYQGTLKYVDTGNLIDGKIKGYQEYTFEEKPSRANVMVDVGDVLFAKMQTSLKVLQITNDERDYVYSTGFYSFRDSRILPDFLKHYFNSKQFNQLKDKLSNGTTMKAINDSGMAKITVDVPSIDKQQSIVATLDKINELIDANKRQLELLDEAVKSRFVEMFDGKGLPVLKWNDVFNTTTGKLDSNAMVDAGQYPFFTCAKEIYAIDTYAFDKEALLLAGNNASGKYDVKYYKGKFNAYQRTYVLDLKQNWSYQLFKYQLEDKLEWLREQSKGSNTRYITLKILGDLDFIIPPLTKQVEFEKFCNHVDKLKFDLQKHNELLAELLNKKMDEYFGGDM